MKQPDEAFNLADSLLARDLWSDLNKAIESDDNLRARFLADQYIALSLDPDARPDWHYDERKGAQPC